MTEIRKVRVRGSWLFSSRLLWIEEDWGFSFRPCGGTDSQSDRIVGKDSVYKEVRPVKDTTDHVVGLLYV